MAPTIQPRTQLYAFTYKKNNPKDCKTQKLDYVLLLRELEDHKNVCIHSVYYELDSTDNWHIHGMFYGPSDLKYRRCVFKGFTSKIKKVYDYAGWECYCRKQQDDEPIDPPDNFKMPKVSLFLHGTNC